MGKMRLEVREYPVKDIEFGPQTHLEGTRLMVKVEDLQALAKQEKALAGIEAAVARPGEAVRIIHVLDAVEGMCKVEGPGTVYPGFVGPPITAGRGVTNKLTGMLILSTTEFPLPMPGGLAFREGVIDMTGPGQPTARLLMRSTWCFAICRGRKSVTKNWTMRCAGRLCESPSFSGRPPGACPRWQVASGN